MTLKVLLCALTGMLSALPLFFILWQCGIFMAAMGKKPVFYPDMPPQRFAVIVCARNEERVIGALLESLRKQDYPSENYEIFTVAHNCTDRTAEIARNCGCQVLIRDNPAERQKSDALRFALEYLNQNRSGEFDCFCVFDADCIPMPDFLYELNKGFSLGADAVSGYYDSLNFNENMTSRVSGLLYHTVMHTTCDPQNRLGLPVNIYGTGFAAKMKWSSEAVRLSSMVEDFELSIRLVLKGAKLAFAPNAVFYAEMPEKLSTALAQRRRWTYGDLQCFRRYGADLLRAVPSGGICASKQLGDALMVPVCLLTAAGLFSGFLLAGLLGFTRLFLRLLAMILILFQITGSICAGKALKSRQKPIPKNLGAILLTPAWIGMTLPMSLAALLFPPASWKTIPHGNQNRIDETEN